MRRLSVFAFALLVSACSAREVPAPAPVPPPPAVVREQGQLIGRTSSELIGRFGAPALRIQEGAGLKLQFRSSDCILDAYLYPSAGGSRVTHVDTRYRSGGDYNQAACIAALSDPNRLTPS
ncbi:MAG: hypothetical protein V4513_04490 [Pseudomonadota bacterium]